MRLVVDASLTLSWYFEDERTAPSDAVLTQVVAYGAWVPSLWRLEVANGLQIAIRRKRIDEVFRDGALQRLGSLPIVIDAETATHAWTTTLRLAGQHNLTIYDAAYLELAQRRRLPIATLDRRLRDAADASGIATQGLDA